MRKQNTYKNIAANIVSMLVVMLLTFISRRVFLTHLNITYFGLNSLCVDVLSMLSLAELGIGQAMVYALYKPIAEDNHPVIRTYMKLYRLLYRYVALLVLVIGLGVMLFLPKLVKQEVSMPLVYTVFSLYLLNAVISYLLSYKRSVLYANQKAYRMVLSDTAFKIAAGIGQIVVLIWLKDLVAYVCVTIASTILGNLYVNLMVDRSYPRLRHISKAAGIDKASKKEIIRNVKAMSIHNMANFFVKNADNIVLSYFLTLGIVGMFSNYMFIIVSAGSVIMKIFDSATASIGNMIVENNTRKTREIFHTVFFANFVITVVMISMLCVLMQPFITLWVGRQYLFPDTVVYLMVGYLYLQLMRSGIYCFKTASGIFDQDKIYPVIQSVVNPLLSVAFVYWTGVAGVLIAKIITSFTLMNWSQAYFTYKYTLKSGMGGYFRRMLAYTAATAAVCLLGIWLCQTWFAEYTLLNILYRALSVFALAVLTVVLLFHRTPEYRQIIQHINELWHNLRRKSV
ncbi:MAG: oligosaccharide flippase family protein [Rikenellaceae bacterium]|nr:oligosaccharide flippase family protein [Rikenellaceae bacterium]